MATESGQSPSTNRRVFDVRAVDPTTGGTREVAILATSEDDARKKLESAGFLIGSKLEEYELARRAESDEFGWGKAKDILHCAAWAVVILGLVIVGLIKTNNGSSASARSHGSPPGVSSREWADLKDRLRREFPSGSDAEIEKAARAIVQFHQTSNR